MHLKGGGGAITLETSNLRETLVSDTKQEMSAAKYFTGKKD